LQDQGDVRRKPDEAGMSTPQDLRELARRSRQRVAEADRLRAEQELIQAATLRRLAETRALLERSAARTAAPTAADD
jgi:hypothetical protein